MESFVKKISKILEVICVILFAAIVLLGTYQIVVRYVFNSPSTVSEELLTYLFTWLALLSGALVFENREHMRMSFIADKVKGKKKIVLEIFCEVVVLLFMAFVMVYGGINITILTNAQVTASLGIPMSIIYAIIPVSGVLAIIFNCSNIIKLVRKFKEV